MTEPETTEPQTWVPSFAGQRPPFDRGNVLSLKHGARSDRLVRPAALAILADLQADDGLPGYLTEPSYRPALLAYASTLARIERIQGWLESTVAEHGVPELSDDGGVRGATRFLERLEASAARQRSDLGLTPMSRARLGKDVAQGQQASLSALWAAQDREERAAAAAAVRHTGDRAGQDGAPGADGAATGPQQDAQDEGEQR